MGPSINYQIKDRLECKKEWLFYYESILNHIEISEKTYFEYYKNKIITFVLIEIINLPINLYRYIRKNNIQRKIRFLKNEISYLEKLISEWHHKAN